MNVNTCPRLAKGVRLQADRVRGGFNLLAPEHVLRLNASAAAILQLCDGERSIADIADRLAITYSAQREQLERDVMALAEQLMHRHMVDI